MNFKRRLPIPMEVKQTYPVTDRAAENKKEKDREIKAVIDGDSDKKLVIVGPCSADDPDAVFTYCEKLCVLSDKVKDRLVVVPRIYTNKPRTTGEGYKGLLTQPDPAGKPDPFKGILAARQLHVKVLTELGMPTADELLYPAEHRFFDDILSYVTVGARSVENQEHRLTASGISVPVGMKNPTSGNITVMLNSVRAAQRKHEFIYRNWDVETDGNPYAHCILRGYTNKRGEAKPNYTYDELMLLCRLYGEAGLEHPAFIVDVNHDNSGKNCFRQPEICFDILSSVKRSPDIARLFKGFMIESYLFDGAQKISADETPGLSITDPCLGWEKTERLLLDIADRI